VTKIGLMGGTFNPIHNGHLFIAEEARIYYSLSKVIFIPNNIPPHRNTGNLPNEDRFNMIKLAIESNPYFDVSRFEIDNSGVSYSVNTVKYFYNSLKNTSLFFISGMDALLNYEWYDFENLMSMLENFIVLSRPGYSKENLVQKINKLYPSCSHKISIFDSILLDISSSGIRQRLAGGKNIKYLVPQKVEEYISEKRLY
jgi:nicotinate-nucleotide adenylyltransferase